MKRQKTEEEKKRTRRLEIKRRKSASGISFSKIKEVIDSTGGMDDFLKECHENSDRVLSMIKNNKDDGNVLEKIWPIVADLIMRIKE